MRSVLVLSFIVLAMTVLSEVQQTASKDVKSKYLEYYDGVRKCLKKVSSDFDTVTKALEKVDGKLSSAEVKEVKKAVEESADVLEGFRETFRSKKVSEEVVEKVKTAGENLKSGEKPDKVNSALSAANDKLQDAIKRRLYSMEGTKDKLVDSDDRNGFGDNISGLIKLGNEICKVKEDVGAIVKSPIIKKNS